MQKRLLLFVFTMGIINAAEETQQNIQWKEFMDSTINHENPPAGAPSFCNTQQSVKVTQCTADFKKSDNCTQECPQVIRGKFLLYCSICATNRAVEKKKQS